MAKKYTEESEEKLEKSIRDLISNTLKKRTGSGQSLAVIQQTTSWLLAIGAGMLIWFASSIDKFTECGHLNYNWLYLTSIIVLSTACACFMVAKLLCLGRTFLVNFALEDLETFPTKARHLLFNAFFGW